MSFVLFQPPFRRHRRRKTNTIALTLTMCTVIVCGLVFLAFSALAVQASNEPVQKLAEGLRRALAQDVCNIRATSASDILEQLSGLENCQQQRVGIVLPPGALALNFTLTLAEEYSWSIIGTGGKDKMSTLRCESDSLESLIDVRSSNVLLSGVQLAGCPCPGLRISTTSPTNITILDSVFSNFTRVLGAGRLDATALKLLEPGSTAALAIVAENFAGNLTIRNTTFSASAFLPPLGRRRVLEQGNAARTWGVSSAFKVDERASASATTRLNERQAATRRITSAAATRKIRHRHGLSRVASRVAHALDGGVYSASWKMAADTSSQNRLRRELQDDSLSATYSMPLLETARQIHPDLQTGPWADDYEATVAVICGSRQPEGCNIALSHVTFNNNTGVATSSLYVLCDGAASCAVDLQNCNFTDNKLLWQEAEKDAFDLTYRADRRLLIEMDVMDDDGNWERTDTVPGPGYSLFTSMVPWLTYTYPMVKYFSTSELTSFSALGDPSVYPSVTGRTLGAVVIHQRNSPAPGASPGGRAMMSVHIAQSTFSGNDGSAIMNTAADFMELAGGNGTWSGGAPRHSVDYNITGVNVTNHASGWPAIWLRWPRRVDISKSRVSNSTGAVWLDEVRDHALVNDTRFSANQLNHLWLDTIGFLAKTQVDGDASAYNLGAGASHVVKIQMTALGTVENAAAVRNCRFRGNPAFTTGVVYVVASDLDVADPDQQPGLTQVTVDNTTFTNNTCRLQPFCISGERSLHIANTHSVSVQSSRFTDNAIGGLYLNSIAGATISTNSSFENNQLTCSIDELQADDSYGGAGVVALSIGSEGITVADTLFRNNTAYVGGGALYLRDFRFVNITGTRFEGNTAQTFDGGAIWMENCVEGVGDNTISDCTFIGNVAGRNGGAVSASNILPSTPGGLTLTRCDFVNNTALVNPNPDHRGGSVADQAGGGAIFASSASPYVSFSRISRNRAYGYAGGGIRVVDSLGLPLHSCTFDGNVAIMGGAVAISRLSQQSQITNCTFQDNTVADPWAWPDTSPVVLDEDAQVPDLSYIDPGYGGAIYAVSSEVSLQTSSVFLNNSAKFGGAAAVISSTSFSMVGMRFPLSNFYPPNFRAVMPDVAQHARIVGRSDLPYMFLFDSNTALLGGALFMYDIDSLSVDVSFGPAFKLSSQPATLFIANTANGGGALYLEGNGQVDLDNCRFALNDASAAPVTGLFGRELDNGTAKAQACFHGGGGGVCIVGQVSKTVTVSSSDLISNTAKDGAGLYLAEGLDCLDQAGCYKVVLDSVSMKGNQATSRGGGVFWAHEGVLNVTSCPADSTHQCLTDGTSLLGLTGTTTGSATASNTSQYNVTLLTTKRKGPADSYNKLTFSKQADMLASIGGPVPASADPVHTRNGTLVQTKRAVFPTDVEPGATVSVNGTLLAAKDTYLTDAGLLKLSADVNLTASNGWPAVVSQPVVLSGSVLKDTTWRGIPYNNLPCAEWDNEADTGDDIATTPYFLADPPRMDFYSSNTDIKFNVSVHDWFGQQCRGDSQTQPLVIVQADSTEVSGAVSVPAADGAALFTALRLRAKEGLHRLNLTGQLYAPVRSLMAAKVDIYVRPCAVNEYLSPKNLDECIPCDLGTYNLNVSAVSCNKCPDNAKCAYPDPAACKAGVDCEATGFMVPTDGYWHASFFSEEVLECPNSDSCTFPNRTQQLEQIQLQVWLAARQIQLNASNGVADGAAAEAWQALLASQPDFRRLLQEKAISDVDDIQQVLQAAQPLSLEYNQVQCAEGYTGNLCGECMPGYGWRRIATCGKCPPEALNNLYYALVTLLTLSMLAFTIYSSLKEQRRPGLLVGGTPLAGKPKVNPGSGAPGGDGGSTHGHGPSQTFSELHDGLGPAGAGAVGLMLSEEPDPNNANLNSHPDMTVPPRIGSGYASGYGIPGYEFVGSGTAAAVHTNYVYASAPGTPKGQPSLSTPFQIYGAAVRSHSVVGVPMRGAPQWGGSSGGPRGPRRPLPPPGSMVEQASGSYTAGAQYMRYGTSPLNPYAARPGMGMEAVSFTAGPGPSARMVPRPVAAGPVAAGPVAAGPASFTAGPARRVAEGKSLTDGSGPSAAGPVAEGKDLTADPALAAAVGQTMEEVSCYTVEGSEGSSPSAVPVAMVEPTGYTNVLYEESSGTMLAMPPQPALAEGPELEQEPEDRVADATDPEAAPPAPRPYFRASHPAFPTGLILQPVPVMHGGSPPLSPVPPRAPSVLPAMLNPAGVVPGALDEGVVPVLVMGQTAAERAAAKAAARRRDSEARERAHQSTVVKIFVSYVQVLALLQNVPLDIPGVVDVYYRINNQAISYPGILVSLDCSLPNSDVAKAIVRVVLTVLAPLYIFAGAVVYFVLFNILEYYVILPYFEKQAGKNKSKRHRRLPSFAMHMECYLGRHLIVTFITIFFFFYPSVVQSLMTIFNCQDVNTPSNNPLAVGLGLQMERVWSQDFGLVCYKGKHLALTLGLGVPGVLLIAIGWPVLSALFMTGKLPWLNNIRFTEDMVSFFLADFKRQFSWWESVIMLRKLAIAVIVTLLDAPTSAGVQLLLVVCVLGIAMAVHLLAMPYRHLYTNNLELFSLGTLLATLYLSLYFSFSSSISDGGRIAISVLILVVNIAMIVTFIAYIIQAYYYAALYTAGAGNMGYEERRNLTKEEWRLRIMENMQQPATDSVTGGPGSGPQRGARSHVASLLATTMWASMRVGSTTSKVLTRVRTMLPHRGEGPSSRDGSLTGAELTDRDQDGGQHATTGTGNRGGKLDGPENGAGPEHNSARSSLDGANNGSIEKPAAPDGNANGAKVGGPDSGSGVNRNRSASLPARIGVPAASVPASASARTAADEVPATAAAAAAAPYGSSSARRPSQLTVITHEASSEANSRLPPAPTGVEPASSTISPAASTSPVGLSPTGAPLSPCGSHRQSGARPISRLAVASNPGLRSGEMLPPPPIFPGRSG